MIYIGLAFHILLMIYVECSHLFSLRKIKDSLNRKTAILAGIVAVLFYVVVNLSLLVLLHAILEDKWEIIYTLKQIDQRKISYQELAIVPTLLLTGTVCALVLREVTKYAVSTLFHDEFISIAQQNRRRCELLIIICILSLSIGYQYNYCFDGMKQLKLNEICAKNEEATLNDGMDYIELRNDGAFLYRIDPDNLYLSDDENNLFKLSIQPCVVQPGDTLLVSLGTDANFSLGSSGGDSIFLCDSNGTILEQISLDVKKGQKTYCRYPAGDSWVYMKPTPGMNNIAKPELSVAAGFYSYEFDLELTSEDENKIFFTTDGSEPTVDSYLYEGPIRVYDRSKEKNIYRSIPNVTYDWMDSAIDSYPVAKSFILQAIAVGPEGQISETTTASYFINNEIYQDQYVIALTASSEDLFGPDGIYSTGRDYDEWYLNGMHGEAPIPNFEVHGLECPAYIEMFINGELYFDQLGGVRVQGASHRSGPIKRFSVFSRTRYDGERVFEKDIFARKETHSITLRPGFENAFSMYLAKGRNVATLESLPVSVFLNGEHWFNGYMLEKYNEDYFRETYGVDRVEFYKTGITEEIKSFLQNNDLSRDEEYEAFNELADIQSYIDYTCINVYLGNTDDSEYNNAGIWRTRYVENDTYGDGRWRWCLYDMDLLTTYYRQEMGLDQITNAQINSFTEARSWTVPVNQRTLFTNLKKNDNFCKQFVLTFMDLINTNFSIPTVTKLLEEWGKDITYNDSFFANRAEYITAYMEDEFNLVGTQAIVKISVSDQDAGQITVNTCTPQFNAGSWMGKYYTDYPITISATPNNGYVFVGWKGAVDSANNEIVVDVKEEGVELIAVFEKYE